MVYSLTYMPTFAVGELELVVLFVTLRLADAAYGAEIRRSVRDHTGREYSVGAIYASLRRLEDKGFVRSFESEPLPVRGGRSRRYFVLTTPGRSALRKAVLLKRRFWKDLTLEWQPR
jgi:PadR family transcriptional regulator, regulatory protein PadR